MAYDNTNRGVLFTNDRKQQENHPDFKGNINVGGVDYWLSAWNKSGEKGSFISLSAQLKEAKPQASAPIGYAKAVSATQTAAPLDDEIPF